MLWVLESNYSQLIIMHPGNGINAFGCLLDVYIVWYVPISINTVFQCFEQNKAQLSLHTVEIHNSDVNGRYIHVGLIKAVMCKSEDLITLQACKRAETVNSDNYTLDQGYKRLKEQQHWKKQHILFVSHFNVMWCTWWNNWNVHLLINFSPKQGFTGNLQKLEYIGNYYIKHLSYSTGQRDCSTYTHVKCV